MNSITAPAVFQFHEHQVRTIMKGDDPWFVAVDVCRALNLTNSRMALRALDADEKGVSSIYTLGGEQRMAVINESGLYTIILRCRDAIVQGTVAHKFRKWVTSEVLPAIRKRGAYVDESMRNNVLGLCTHVEFLRSWWKEYEPAIRALAPDVAYRVHDHFIEGVCFSRGVARAVGITVNARITTYPWRADSYARSAHLTGACA